MNAFELLTSEKLSKILTKVTRIETNLSGRTVMTDSQISQIQAFADRLKADQNDPASLKATIELLDQFAKSLVPDNVKAETSGGPKIPPTKAGGASAYDSPSPIPFEPKEKTEKK